MPIPTLTLPLYTADSTVDGTENITINHTFLGTGGGFQHEFNSFITAFSSTHISTETINLFNGNNWYGFWFELDCYDGKSLEYTGDNYLGSSDYKGVWVLYSFEKQYHITGFKIWAQQTFDFKPHYNPAQWRLYGSNDNGATWEEITQGHQLDTNAVYETTNHTFEKTFSPTKAYSTYGICIHKVMNRLNLTPSGYIDTCVIAEFRLYGYSAETIYTDKSLNIIGDVTVSGNILFNGQELNLEPYALTADLPDLTPYALTADLPDLTPYALTADLPDLTPYALTEDLPDLEPYALTADLPDLEPYALTADLPDLEPYALTEDLPDLEPYALTADLPDLEPYALTADLPDLEPYALTADLFSGSYADLTNTPSLFSGSYTDLTDKPITNGIKYTYFQTQEWFFPGFNVTDYDIGSDIGVNDPNLYYDLSSVNKQILIVNNLSATPIESTKFVIGYSSISSFPDDNDMRYILNRTPFPDIYDTRNAAWVSARDLYDTSGDYQGNNYLGNDLYKGEWLFFRFENTFAINKYKIGSWAGQSFPLRFRVYGTNDNGLNWDEIEQASQIDSDATYLADDSDGTDTFEKSFDPPERPYNIYGFCFHKKQFEGRYRGDNGEVIIDYIEIYGVSVESEEIHLQTLKSFEVNGDLEVSGNILLNGDLEVGGNILLNGQELNLEPYALTTDLPNLTPYALTVDLFSGDYGDLTNTPDISRSGLSGNYNDLLNKPDIFEYTDFPLTGKECFPYMDASSWTEGENNPVRIDNYFTGVGSGTYQIFDYDPSYIIEAGSSVTWGGGYWSDTYGSTWGLFKARDLSISGNPDNHYWFTTNSYNKLTGEYAEDNYLGNDLYKGEWLYFKFQTKFRLSRYRIEGFDDNFPTTWRVYGTNDDGVTWDEVPQAHKLDTIIDAKHYYENWYMQFDKSFTPNNLAYNTYGFCFHTVIENPAASASADQNIYFEHMKLYGFPPTLPDLTDYALTTDIPDAPDLTPYALKTELLWTDNTSYVSYGHVNVYNDKITIDATETVSVKYTRENMSANTHTYADGTTNVKCRVSDYYTNGNYDGWKAFNGTKYMADYWGTNVRYNVDGYAERTDLWFDTHDDFYGEYIILDLGEQIVLNHYKYYPLNLNLSRAPRNFRMYATNDDSAYDNTKSASWRKIDERSDITEYADNTGKTFTLTTTPDAFRYYAIIVNRNNGDYLLNFSELELFSTHDVEFEKEILTTTLNKNLHIEGHIIPTDDVLYNLGSIDKKWKDLYLSGDTIYLNNTRISADPVTDGVIIKNSEDNITSITASSLSLTDPTTGNVVKIETTGGGIKFNEYTPDNQPVASTPNEFITAADLPDLTPYALAVDIPTLPDLTPYALAVDIPTLPDLTPYALVVDIPTLPDLTPYALVVDIPTLPDLTPYALVVDIPKLPDLTPYALVVDIPTLPDLTPYALAVDIPTLPDLTPYALAAELKWTDNTSYISYGDIRVYNDKFAIVQSILIDSSVRRLS